MGPRIWPLFISTKEGLMKLKFLVDGYYNGQHKYEAGKTYDISNELGEADRWLKRGAIQVVEVENTVEEVVVVKEVVKKENVRGNKRNKGIPLNETSEIL